MSGTVLRKASVEDFPLVFPLIKSLWSYNEYEENATKAVFSEIVGGKSTFAVVAERGGEIVGFCHGDFFSTLWMCGKTCYLSGIITKESERGKGIGKKMLDYIEGIAKSAGCRAIILESGISRTAAHRFYESNGFEKSCYGFEKILS